MAKRALEHPSIRFEWNAAVAEVRDVEKGEVTAVVLKNTENGRRASWR